MTDPVTSRLIEWGKARADIRAMILTSSRASPRAKIDLFSDYDVIIAVLDVDRYLEDKSWLSEFGPVLVVYHDPPREHFGGPCFREIVQYETGLKIDFNMWPADVLARVATETALPDELDVGYIVLLDKDDLTSRLKPPSYQAYVPSPPSEAVYQTLIEEFFQDGTYVAKHLWRGDLLSAKYNLDHAMKFTHLHTMLIWRYEIDHNWSIAPGDHGKGLKHRLPADIWRRFEATYTGPEIAENWKALFATVALFRDVATEVGKRLGYIYLDDLDRRCTRYFETVRHLESGANEMPIS